MTGAQYQKAIDRFNLSQVDSARMFRVNDRTVRRWIADQVPIPHAIAIVLALMRTRQITPDEIVALFGKKKKGESRVEA